MKRLMILLFAMFLGVQFVAAQDQAAKPYSWNEIIHDFGKIKLNEPATVTFEVKNTGTTPLIITAAKSSCGCTVAEYTKEPIKPDGTGIVKATYNSARPGAFTKSVTVTFDGIATPEVLMIKGEVEGAPAPAPAEPTPVK